MGGALDDIRVIEYGYGLGGTLATRLLADLGAEVIKVEPPVGDPMRKRAPFKAGGASYAFQLTAANKKSVVIDWSQPRQREQLKELLATADMVVEHDPVPPLKELALTHQKLLEDNPRLIYCTLTPFGLTGPLANKPGAELVVEAMSGHMAVTGETEDPPTRTGPPIANHIGGVFASIATLGALNYRDRTGRGQLIDISMHDVLIGYLAIFLPKCFADGRAEPRMGNRHPLVAPWNSFPCSDGWIIIAFSAENHWERCLRIMGREDLIGSPRYATLTQRVQLRDEIEGMIAQWTKTKPVKEVVSLFEKGEVPVGPILTVSKLLKDEHFHHRNMVVEVEDPKAGKMVTIGSMFGRMSETPGKVRTPAPTLGQHTEGVLSSLPERRKKMEALEAEKVVAARGGAGEAPRALEGVRIVELSTRTTGPYCGRILANLGAEMIKVEPPPHGEHTREIGPFFKKTPYLFHSHNVDREDLCVDLKAEKGQKILRELAAKSDVFLENMAAGAIQRMGFGYETMKEINPSIVFCSVNGFGQTGPYRNYLGMDTTLQAMAGVLNITGWPHKSPVKIGVSIVDLMGGTFSPLGILAALHYRNRTGKGQYIDMSMHDLAGWLSQDAWPVCLATGQDQPRYGNRHPRYSPHNSYKARDGLVVIAIEKEEQWPALLRAMGRGELIGDNRYDTGEKRVAKVDELDEIVSSWTKGLTIVEVVEACDKAGVPAGPILEIHEVVNHSHTLARESIVERPDDDGDLVKVTGSPFKMSETPGRVHRAAPKAGSHNGYILKEILGYRQEEVDRLRAEKVIVEEH